MIATDQTRNEIKIQTDPLPKVKATIPQIQATLIAERLNEIMTPAEMDAIVNQDFTIADIIAEAVKNNQAFRFIRKSDRLLFSVEL